MPRKHVDVRLAKRRGGAIDGVFRYDSDEPGETVGLTIWFLDRTIEARDVNYFAAFCRIREQLEVFGLRPLCMGSCRNVSPAGMWEGVGGGLIAVKLKLGMAAEHHERPDLVSIFEPPDPGMEPVSVAEQECFFRAWQESLRTVR
jgi:hypothetical protein